MKNTIIATENTTVLDMTMLFAYVLSDTTDNYNAVVDSALTDTRACRDDYIHVYRHDTTNQANRAHNNVFKCYFKHKKQCVNIKCNKANFEAFASDIEHIRQIDRSEYRYIVSYNDFIAFMREIIAFDNARSTTQATKENALQIAK